MVKYEFDSPLFRTFDVALAISFPIYGIYIFLVISLL